MNKGNILCCWLTNQFHFNVSLHLDSLSIQKVAVPILAKLALCGNSMKICIRKVLGFVYPPLD